MAMIPRMYYGGHSVYEPYYQQQAVWDPFQEVPHGGSSLVAAASPESRFELTKLDWKETPEAHVFKAELPGLKKNEVKVEVEEGRVLCIRGEKSVEKEVSGGTWHRVERSSGAFVRRFRLPEDAKLDKLTACLERGCSPSQFLRKSTNTTLKELFRSMSSNLVFPFYLTMPSGNETRSL